MGEDWKLELKQKKMQQAKVGHVKCWSKVAPAATFNTVFTVCSLHLQEAGAVTMPGQFPPSMKKKLLEPLSSQEEMENAKVCHVQ